VKMTCDLHSLCYRYQTKWNVLHLQHVLALHVSAIQLPSSCSLRCASVLWKGWTALECCALLSMQAKMVPSYSECMHRTHYTCTPCTTPKL
jgi:hypothetical protein